MESRLRKLLSPRRAHAQQANDVAELDLHSVPYTTAPSQGRLPVFVKHPLGKPSTIQVQPVEAPDLHSLSYESTVPGRPPQLGDRPQRGNGPVKLQTSRRLSSGELLVTQQDYDRTLDDIRQGDYILGGKDRRTSQATTQSKPAHQPSDSRVWSNSPNASRTQPTFSSPLWAPPSSMSDDAVFGASAEGHYFGDSGDHVYYSGSRSSTTGLGITTPAQQLYPRHAASISSLLEPHEEKSPTIQALWKAEYSRLVSIYGQAGVDQNINQLNQEYLNKPLPDIDPRIASTRHPGHLSSTHSLPPPVEPARRGLEIRNITPVPHLELAYRDDHSEQSSNQRHSLLSSSGTSSSFTTTRTSMAEEPVTSRDDIRKIVDDMRLTYLQAIEAQTPPPPSLSEPAVRKPRSKKQTRSLTSPASVESGLGSSSRRSKNSRSKSWQSSSSSPQTSVNPSSLKSSNWRTSSAPGRRTSNLLVPSLPAIQASPARAGPGLKQPEADAENDEHHHDIGLKRADSTTLGSMAANLTIVDDERLTPSPSPKNISTSSPTFYNSSESESESGPDTSAHTPSFSLSPSSRPSPVQTPPTSVQHTSTPANHKPSAHSHDTADRKSSWQEEADRLFAESELDLSLEIEDFESLCDDLFNTPGLGRQSPGILRAWDADEGRAYSGKANPESISTGSPSRPTRNERVVLQSDPGRLGNP
ncbi:hypothetical protein A1O1_03740 [Capronia coronata CBS 617.96]|uniref:Uncharacterized protein n=1 Tax=Capronia coronata CBS 617.96 TaxID=1182541 RepID=W9YCM6_9EURO|nr:uncharacterized protein A1O1_03740 [Capronia coronata CBS 617.96]EXJ90637.1 hypothetical protein A1O1_03740 [Capronia coronata CBS 617.96]